jgi:flagellar hook-length control protein FliK
MHCLKAGTIIAPIKWLKRYDYMNVNLLTIDCDLAATIGTRPSVSNPDSDTKGNQFVSTLDNEKLKGKISEKPTADNIKDRVQNQEKAVGNSTQEFKESIDKQIKSENSCKNDNKTSFNEQNANSDSTEQQAKRPNVIQSWFAEHLIAVGQNKEGAVTKNEAKPSSQIAQFITNAQNKSSSVTGQAVKSSEIKLIHSAEKGQLGIKTILPTKSNGQNGLKAIRPELAKSAVVVKKQPETSKNNEKAAVPVKNISLTEKGNTQKLVPAISDNTGKSTKAPGVKPSIPNINLTTGQDKTSETKPHLKQVDFEKLKLTADTEAKTKKSQNIPNLSNPNRKESIHTDNNISENKSVQKLKASSVQIIAGQTKEQSNSVSNKSSSQGFEQMLSQHNPQTLITEQSSIPAKSATAANSSNQSSSDVSADIGRQILESVQRSMSQQGADHQITVRLNPPELGKVLIKFQQQDSELTGLMEVNKSQTRFEIEQALPQIIRNLANCGIHIKRLDVMLSNEQQPGQGTLGNQSLQYGGAQQQYSANPGTSGNDSAFGQSNEWLSSNNNYDNLSELQEALITDGSINMLV